MPPTPELVRDHEAPRQGLAHALHDARELFRAVLGERSTYAAQAQDLSGRLDCYRRGRDSLMTANQISRQGLGDAAAASVPTEHPRAEKDLHGQAHAGIRAVTNISKRYK